MLTYLFYDIESTGLNKCFDQILQFAAIRTDSQFNELQRHEFLVKLNCDIIPSPYATITHQIAISDCAHGYTELAALEQIHAQMNQPHTISLGYNTLNFDDELLRFSFYRNLLAPYTHQYANHCSRMDIYPIAIMFYLFKNDVIHWPMSNQNISLKLEDINNANNFSNARCHHALNDVTITLALAKKLRQQETMWQYLIGYFNKKIAQQRFAQLRKVCGGYCEGLLIDSNLGNHCAFQAPVLGLGYHHYYTNQAIWLRLDLPDLRQTTPDNIHETTWAINTKLGEANFILPMKERFLSHLTGERKKQVKENKRWLWENQATLQAIANYYRHYTYPKIAADVDAALYLNDFWSDQDHIICQQFHQALPSQKAVMIETMENANLKKMATRVMGRHFPNLLNNRQQQQFDHYFKQIFSSHPPVDFRGRCRYSKEAALQDIKSIKKQQFLTIKQQQLLDELECYIL